MSSQNEEEYFAQLEIQKKKKLIEEVRGKMDAAEAQKLKELHFNHCSKCGGELHEVIFKDVVIDKCFNCRAVVLDFGELEKLAGEETGIVESFISLFSSDD